MMKKSNRLPPVHPGEILLEDFMKPLGITQYRLAKDIGVSSLRVSQIVRGKRSITADTAMRLARYFGTSAGIWMRIQARYDLEVAQAMYAAQIAKEVKVLRPASGEHSRM
jgi:addiction module HigA family antidote